jgi:hypothetical protein
MKNLFLIILSAGCLFSCTQQNKNPQTAPSPSPAVKSEDFFPVTTFILGQITEIRSNGLNPLKITTAGNKTDSTWLKVEELENEFAEFLHPTIDSSNMARFFKESKFLDQTLNAFTFTYEPLAPLPDSMELQRWDVYINPRANTVRRIYIEKVKNANKQLQLTWQSKEWCRQVSISGNGEMEKEVLIKWKFE